MYVNTLGNLYTDLVGLTRLMVLKMGKFFFFFFFFFLSYICIYTSDVDNYFSQCVLYASE